MSDFDRLYPTSLTGPPRRVPLAVRMRLLFGGYLSPAGWFVWGFGMIFFWTFVLNSDITSWYVFSGDLEKAQGTVTDSRDTNASVGGSKHSRGTPVYATDYEFESGGQRYTGSSYQTGGRKEFGQQVQIEFPSGRPQVSRIVGARTAVFPGLAALVGVVPLIGLTLVMISYIRNSRLVRLLRHGVATTGKLVESRPTNTQINSQRVYELIFEFTAEDGSVYEAKARTHETKNLRDDEQEPLLYYPWNPEFSTLLDHLPGGPKIDEEGQIRTDGLLATIRVMIIPVLVLTGHAIYAIVRYS